MQTTRVYEREYSLDVLKILGTILIVFHHYQQVMGVKFSYVNFAGGSFYFGNIVELFFVLSGFFMFHYIEKIKNGALNFSDFIKRRYFRLMPLVVVSAVVFEVLISIYPYICATAWLGDTKPTIIGTIISCLGIQAGWANNNPCVNNPTWYISVLILCYLIFFFICYLGRKGKYGGGVKIEYCFVFMILLGMGITEYSINLPFLNYYSSRGYVAFFVGVLLGEYLSKKEITKKMCWSSIIVFGVIIYIVIAYPTLVDAWTLTFIAYPALVIIFRYPSVKNLFRYKWIGSLAQISYNVYIWHICMLIVMQLIIQIFGWKLNMNSYTIMFSFCIVAFIVATISHFVLEKRFAHVVNRFIE